MSEPSDSKTQQQQQRREARSLLANASLPSGSNSESDLHPAAAEQPSSDSSDGAPAKPGTANAVAPVEARPASVTFHEERAQQASSRAVAPPTGVASAKKVPGAQSDTEEVLLKVADDDKTPASGATSDAEDLTPLDRALKKSERVHENRGVRMFLSNIFKSGFHLKRWAPAKDLIVPTGPQAGLVGSAFNLANSIIGAGILGLPFATARAGIVFAALLFVAVALLTWTTIRMLMQSAQVVDTKTYVVLVYKSFGIWGARYVDVIQILMGLGSMIAYHIIIADFVRPVMLMITDSASVATNRAFLIGIVALVFIAPLSFKKNINSLRFTSFLSMVLVLFFVVALLVVGAESLQTSAVAFEMVYFKLDVSTLSALPIILFAFVCHSSVFPIYAEMKDRTVPGMSKVSGVAVGFSYLAYSLVGLYGYGVYGPSVAGNVINSLPQASPLVAAVRICMAFTIVTTFPLVHFSFRLSFEHLLFGPERQFTSFQRFVETALVMGSTVTVACFVDDVSIVFGFIGSIGAASLMLILPALVYMRVMPGTMRTPKKIAALLLLILGLALLVVGVVANILSLLPA